jgi:hypothetical protein
MNLRLGIYEIFSRIVPGGVYIVATIQLLKILGVVTFDWQAINNLSLIASLGLVVAAYILSEAVDRIAVMWFRIFRKNGFSTQCLNEFKQKHRDQWEINAEDKDWPVLLAFIRTKNLELADETERHNALSIMLRNVSLGVLFMSITTLIQYVSSWNSSLVLISIILFVLSILLVRDSVKFRRWFYYSIFETILAYRIDLEKIIKPVRHSARQKSDKSEA